MKCEEFIRGYKEYERRDPRDAMYRVATFVVEHFYCRGDYAGMANALGVLLLTWNQPFYRYGSFDFDKLEKCINDNFPQIENFRKRDIFSLSENDKENIVKLFNEFLEALQSKRKIKIIKSPVAVSKVLHLLSPNFFPLWDCEIAKAYKCNYNNNPAEKYFSFCKAIKELAEKVRNCEQVKKDIEPYKKTLLKLIDEYNFSKYTKRWI